MRITNKMMTNNMMSNINKNKLSMTALEQQYSTGKKIQKPSDDPIVTVRALKLRTNLSELSQYYEKNIPDAKSWMDVTESALTTVNDILKQINSKCVQGSTDTLTASDRTAIVQSLEQMKDQIYQEGNTNYAGRYVFTGYKTDSTLTFTEATPNLSYSITEEFTGEQIQIINKISGGYNLEDFDNTSITFDEAPQMKDTYRIQLSYDKLDSTPPENIRYYIKSDTGEMVEQAPIEPIVLKSAADGDAYTPAPGTVNYIQETGELILSSERYDDLRKADKMEITYSKTGFEEGELKPEHYFNCVMTDNSKPEVDAVEYKKESQQIEYEINYNQKIKVNTEGTDAISHQIGRHINDILNAVNEVTATEQKIAEVDKRLTDTSLSEADKQRYEKLKEQLDTELELKKEAMQQAFEKGITVSSKEQDRVNTAVADLGSRYVRLELSENRLSSQKVDFEDLLSKNEDVDMVDTVIKYNSAETIYNASLNAASRVVQNTLLDFL
jgi:flagellar hook-associated protein 3 FlgL